MKKKVIVFFSMLLIFGAFLFFVQISHFGSFGGFSSITGFAIFEETSGEHFNQGSYANTTHNGSAVVLSGSNVVGTYTSKVFDAGILSNWNNLSFVKNNSSREDMLALDASSAVFLSKNKGISWTQQTSNYGAGGGSSNDMYSDGRKFYIIFSSTNKRLWMSENLGVNWSIINDAFSGPSLELGVSDYKESSYIFRGSGDVYKSTDEGLNWSLVGDINPSTATPKGVAINSTGAMFAVDANGDVWVSVNDGVTWSLRSSGYGGGGSGTDDMTVDLDGNLYILFNKKVFRSIDQGFNWTLVNNSFTSFLQDGVKMISFENEIYITDTVARIFRSTNQGVNWDFIGDFNGASASTPKGFSHFNVRNNLSYQVRNCSSSDCSDGVFVGPDGTAGSFFTNDFSELGLQSRYFQYRVYFSTGDAGFSPTLSSVVIDYEFAAVAPIVSIISPTNNGDYSYANLPILLNFSVVNATSPSDKCWYTLDGGSTNISLENCNSFNLGINQVGNYNLIVYANESVLGLVGQDEVNFSVYVLPPTINILNPSDLSIFGNNENILLNFSVVNATSPLDKCWYTLDGGNTNISLENCQATTFNLSDSGSYNLIVYANESVSGLTGSDEISFTLQLGAPNINSLSPIDVYLNYGNNVEFSYFVSDVDLTMCELWGDFSGTFSFVKSDESVLSDEVNYFYANLSDGDYSWSVKCVDEFDNWGDSGIKTFYVDTTPPAINVFHPSGNYNNYINIPFVFEVSDISLVSCYYNVSFAVSGLTAISQKEILNCANTNFSLDSYSNYILSFKANDSAGNIGYGQSTFSVNPSTTPVSIPSGGGGGVGGSSLVITVAQFFDLQIDLIEKINVRRGQAEIISMTVTNTGNKFLNKCKLELSEEIGNWISNKQVESLSPGQKVDFVFSVSVPQNINVGIYDSEIVVVCEEFNKEVYLSVDVFSNDFGFNILSSRKEGTKLIVEYVLENYLSREQEIKLNYDFNNIAGAVLLSGELDLFLEANERKADVLIFELPKNSFGEFDLVFNIANYRSDLSYTHPLKFNSPRGLTGFAVSEENQKVLGFFAGAVIFGVVVFFLVKVFIKHYRMRSNFAPPKRNFIKIDLR